MTAILASTRNGSPLFDMMRPPTATADSPATTTPDNSSVDTIPAEALEPFEPYGQANDEAADDSLFATEPASAPWPASWQSMIGAELEIAVDAYPIDAPDSEGFTWLMRVAMATTSRTYGARAELLVSLLLDRGADKRDALIRTLVKFIRSEVTKSTLAVVMAYCDVGLDDLVKPVRFPPPADLGRDGFRALAYADECLERAEGITPAHAAERGLLFTLHAQVKDPALRVLINDPDPATGRTPLMVALAKGHFALVPIFVHAGGVDPKEALERALRLGDVAVVDAIKLARVLSRGTFEAVEASSKASWLRPPAFRGVCSAVLPHRRGRGMLIIAALIVLVVTVGRFLAHLGLMERDGVPA